MTEGGQRVNTTMLIFYFPNWVDSPIFESEYFETYIMCVYYFSANVEMSM